MYFFILIIGVDFLGIFKLVKEGFLVEEFKVCVMCKILGLLLKF